MLQLAREACGLVQADVAARAQVVQGTYSKFETGIAEPSPELVGGLARVLGVPPQFFYEPGRPYGFPPFHYRKRKKLTAKALGKIVAQMNIRRMHIQKLSVSFALAADIRIPEIDADAFLKKGGGRDTEDVARILRELWMLPAGPIGSMADLIESHGGIVIECDFGTDLLDAMSQRVDGMPILFFVNSNSPADRVRFTMAHELGHMVLHTTTLNDDDTMEDEADRFAAAFMLPANEFKPQLRTFDLRQLANMKSYWGVSMAALAMRADSLNLITDYQKKKFWMEMSKLGYRTREPNEPAREEGRLMRRMIQYHTNKLGYSVEDMCKLLCMTRPSYEFMYGIDAVQPQRETRHLRAVN